MGGSRIDSFLHKILPFSTAKTPLCAVCQSKINGRFKSAKKSGQINEFGLSVDHHRTLASFRASANQECQVCVALWQQIPLSQRDGFSTASFRNSVTRLHFPNYAVLMPNMSPGPNAIDMSLYLLDYDGDSTDIMTSYTLELSQDPEKYSLHSPAANDTGSVETLSLARNWYNECATNHNKCNAARSCKGWFPSRLIDIGLSANCEPRLSVTKETPPNGEYVTLSHCWGSARFVQLTCKSLDRMKRKIPMSELPKTFVDAIYVTRWLGFRYIWIDSLCIIQDSTSDWLDEALLMHLVYANSMCNIAATGAADSSEGLFRERTVHNLYPCEIATSSDGIGKPLKYHIIDKTYWSSHIESTQLNQRAWVVQERFLAPRVLHFGVTQLLWECREMSAGEKYPMGLPMSLKEISDFKSFEPTISREHMQKIGGRDWDESYNFNMLWNKIVKLYSSSRLTNTGDKMIALAGIAKMLQSVMNDEYVVGLWKEYLPSQLSWTVEDCRQSNGQPSFRPSSYLAPSWSWLSVEGVVNASGWIKSGSLIDIIDVVIVPQTSDMTGPIIGGFIRVKGVLKQLRLERELGTPESWNTYVDGAEIFEMNAEILPEVDTPIKLKPTVSLDVNNDSSMDNLYLLCLGDYKMRFEMVFSERTGIGERYFEGLIVEPTGNGAGEFRRLGVVLSSVPRLIDKLIVPSENGENMPCESYDASTSKHTIRII